MAYRPRLIICFSSVFDCLHSQPDALRSRGVKGRDGFKAYKAAARIDSRHSSRAGVNADVCHQLPGPGIGSDKILTQLHGFLRGVDGTLYFLLHGVYPADVLFLSAVTQKNHTGSSEKRTVSSDHLYSGYFHLLTTRPWDGGRLFLRL